MNTTPQNSKTNGKASSETGYVTNGKDQREQSELDMLYSLKSTIDSNGRFKYRLNDLATGYAAGRGIDPIAARAEIIEKFEQQFGMDPLGYSNQLFEQRREKTQSHTKGSTRSR